MKDKGKTLNHRLRSRFSDSWFDNRKSKIQNPKWAGSFTLLTALAMCGEVAEAQQPGKVSRVGYLTNASLAADADRHDAFRQALRELGYVEGKDIVIEWRTGEGSRDRQRAVAVELVRLKVDVIVAAGSGDIRAAKEA